MKEEYKPILFVASVISVPLILILIFSIFSIFAPEPSPNVSDTPSIASQIKNNSNVKEIEEEPKKEKTKEYTGPLPEHCKDGVYSEGEEGLDCGWTCPNKCKFTEESGKLERDAEWSGNIKVSGELEVPKGVELIIRPKTVVKFEEVRKYKSPEKGAIVVSGGKIDAKGTEESRIWFTSAAENPMNGDWNYIKFNKSNNSRIEYVIIEFSEKGIVEEDSRINISDSIIRWCNYEGLLFKNSESTLTNNLIYENGYYEAEIIDNSNVSFLNNTFKEGRFGIYCEKSTVNLEGNYFLNYGETPVNANLDSYVTLIRNKFENISKKEYYSERLDSDVYSKYNDFEEGTIADFTLGFENIINFELSYLPGDSEDKYQYIYDGRDITREVEDTFGDDILIGSTLEYEDDYIYLFSKNPTEKSKFSGFIKINPRNNYYLRYYNTKILAPTGLTWDDKFFYSNDYYSDLLYKFRIIGNLVKVKEEYDLPDQCKGDIDLSSGEDYIYVLNRDDGKVCMLDKENNLSFEEEFTFEINNSKIEAITFENNRFWTVGGCKKGICSWDENGTLTGEIYPVAKETLALDWGEGRLWTLQETCKAWSDPKIYKIKILNSSV